jgi:outer membrane protein assembly factor BamB
MKPAFIVTIIFSASLAAADAPQFRGPGGRGVSSEKGLPVEWSDQQNMRWKAELPGRGLSNPVIADGRVYVTAASGFEQKRLHVLCFDVKNGGRLWEREFAATGTTLCHPKTNMAAPTPVTDGRRVYALFATADLACLDKDGNLVWYRSLVGDYPTIGNNVGMAASPTLHKDTLIVVMENVGASFAAGIDVNTGANRWRVPRPRGIVWTTPLVIDNQGRPEVLIQSGGELVAHDPATGQQLWRAGGGFNTISSPAFGDGMIFTPSGKFTALRPAPGKDASGKETPGKEPATLWQNNKLSTGHSSPLYYQGLIYTVSARGVVNCAEPGTGKVLWTERLEGNFSASPLGADGKVYVASEEGATSVLEAGAAAKVLAVNTLADTILASPVAAAGAIFLRSDKHLYCIGH